MSFGDTFKICAPTAKPRDNFTEEIEAFLAMQSKLRRKRKKQATQTSAGVKEDKKTKIKKTFQVGVLAKESNICCY